MNTHSLSKELAPMNSAAFCGCYTIPGQLLFPLEHCLNNDGIIHSGPSHRGVFPPEHTFSKEDWISVLHLSTMWDFSTVRGIAIRELTKGAVKEMSHMEVILLARRFKVREWLLMGYKGLVLDTKVPTEDAEVLGWKTAYRILQLREDHKHLRTMAPQATSSEYQRSASKRKRSRPSGPMSSAFTERLRLEELSIVIERSFLDELAVDGYEVESTVYPTDMIISNSSSNYYHSRQ